MSRWGHFAIAAALALSAAACGSGRHEPATGGGGNPGGGNPGGGDLGGGGDPGGGDPGGGDPGGGDPGGVTPPVCTEPGASGAWPICNTTYGAADGILESPIVAMTMDEAQNRWLATPYALYLLRPGDEKFTRFDELDGLHLGMVTGRTPGPIGWAKYCDQRPIADDEPCVDGTVMWGGAAGQGITSLAGGRANEVFVGYGGTHSNPLPPRASDGLPYCPGAGWSEIDWCDPYAHSGKIDWVRLQPDESLAIDRFDLHSTGQGGDIWHERLVYRLAYDHFVNPGTLYAATEHGVVILFPDRFRDPAPGEYFDIAAGEYMGDHLHAMVCRNDPPASCAENGTNPKMGTWLGLAIDAQGRMWHAGWWTAGRITWDPHPLQWKWRETAAFDASFGDPYLGPGDGVPPVFEVASGGHEPRMTGVAVCPDGSVWFSSEGAEDGPARDRGDVLASWDGRTFRYFTGPQLGLSESSARDVACLPDGRVVVAGVTSGLSVYDPATGRVRPIRASSGMIRSDAVRRIEVDRTADPATLLVATEDGAAAIRVVP